MNSTFASFSLNIMEKPCIKIHNNTGKKYSVDIIDLFSAGIFIGTSF